MGIFGENMKDYTFRDYFLAYGRMMTSADSFLKPKKNGLDPKRLVACLKFKLEEHIEDENIFQPYGTKVFCGSQGNGKTLTAGAVFTHQLLDYYPFCILVTNTKFKDRPFNAYVDFNEIDKEELQKMYEEVRNDRINAFYNEVIEELKKDFYKIEYPEYTLEEYLQLNIVAHPFDETSDFEDFCNEKQYVLRDILSNEPITQESIKSGKHKKVTVRYNGMVCLKYINNGKLGVIFFIDEIHLDFLSTVRNIPIEAAVEISQQRKQRKLIVGTSQRYIRMNKLLREQIRDIIACRCYFGCIQYNQLIDGESTSEDSNGKLKYQVKRRMIFFHDPSYYEYYDTYAKMQRLNSEWQGRPNLLVWEDLLK